MNETTETTPVTDFILSSEKNLRIAEAVHSEWDSVKGMIAKGFCRRLEAEFKKKLPEWKSEDDGLLTTRRGSFWIWKPRWENQYAILLQPEDYGAVMTYGILRNEHFIKKRPFSTELLEAIKKQVPSARSKDWWEALIKFHSPAPDWSTAEVLWRMHTENGFMQEVAEQLLELAKLSERIVDSLVAKYGSKKQTAFSHKVVSR